MCDNFINCSTCCEAYLENYMTSLLSEICVDIFDRFDYVHYFHSEYIKNGYATIKRVVPPTKCYACGSFKKLFSLPKRENNV